MPKVNGGAERLNDVKWKPSEKGFYKINYDAALNVSHQWVGIGVVIRDSQGQVMASSMQRIKAGYDPQLTEAVAVLRGIKLEFDTDLVPFVAEIDALGVVNRVNSGDPIASDIGMVEDEIVNCFRISPRGSVTHVPRNANFVAHTLSKHVLSMEEDCFWIEDYPPWRTKQHDLRHENLHVIIKPNAPHESDPTSTATSDTNSQLFSPRKSKSEKRRDGRLSRQPLAPTHVSQISARAEKNLFLVAEVVPWQMELSSALIPTRVPRQRKAGAQFFSSLLV
ncbi:hypothetical protein Dsin_017357 [Dipteronia sinensis]|uniref:RNase H type-1 domain-containing protein n=1 Tax=Dipteronia sinensis TaxID=43782 RepID=A0AAE0AES7_9ROSI|nr:hypothetical protein Dsin_017357 [Dipteronia sinensis]